MGQTFRRNNKFLIENLINLQIVKPILEPYVLFIQQIKYWYHEGETEKKPFNLISNFIVALQTKPNWPYCATLDVCQRKMILFDTFTKKIRNLQADLLIYLFFLYFSCIFIIVFYYCFLFGLRTYFSLFCFLIFFCALFFPHCWPHFYCYYPGLHTIKISCKDALLLLLRLPVF